MNQSITDVEVLDEIPLEKTIENTLVKHNVTEAVINSLKEKYGSLRLKSLDDKESYLEVKEAKKNVRKIGILTEKLCEEGRADAVKVQKLWLAKQKEILAKIALVEDPLQAEIDRYDAEVKRKEDEIERLKQEESIKRQQILTKMGAMYSDGCFTLANASYEANIIKDADAEMWNDVILPKYDREYQKIEAVRIEQERLRTEQEEKLRKEREEFEAQQRAFKEQQEAFAKQQAELEKQKNEAAQKAEDERRAKIREQLDRRANQLRALGMTFNFQYDAYVYEDVNIDNKTEISLLSDAEWDTLVSKITPVIAERKKSAEEKRLADLAAHEKMIAEKAAQAERDRIEQEKKDAELKKQQELQRQAEEMAKANDKTKWEHILQQLNSIVLPEMKSGIYKGKLAILREKIEEINSL